MSVYILYRKTNIRDGHHEPTDRLFASTKLSKIFSVENYEKLLEHEEEYNIELEKDEEDEEYDGIPKYLYDYFYFILEIKLDKMTSVDDGELFWNPSHKRFKKFQVFGGDLEQFRKMIKRDNTLKVLKLPEHLIDYTMMHFYNN